MKYRMQLSWVGNSKSGLRQELYELYSTLNVGTRVRKHNDKNPLFSSFEMRRFVDSNKDISIHILLKHYTKEFAPSLLAAFFKTDLETYWRKLPFCLRNRCNASPLYLISYVYIFCVDLLNDPQVRPAHKFQVEGQNWENVLFTSTKVKLNDKITQCFHQM